MIQPIPQEWIRDYVDKLVHTARDLPEKGRMRNAVLLRADHIMDMVDAFHESQLRGEKKT
jgi:hypothetical protein